MLLKTNKGPIFFEILGQGPPLVLISGWAMSCECWRPVVALLKHQYRCLIYDSRGVGRSQPFAIDASFTIEDHAEDLHTLLEATETYNAAVVGHEMGSLIAAVNAARHPQDVNSMVVVSPRKGLTQDDVKTLAVFTPASLALRELAAYPLLRNLVARRFRRAPQPFRDRLFNDFADLSPRAAYETALSASGDEVAGILDEVVSRDSSVLFVCGEKDKKGSREARRLFSTAKAGKLATMRDCGFLPMLEYPRQFARLIQSFIQSRERSINPHAIAHIDIDGSTSSN
jgi:pimeloyl-ACP methyl ester carboxylesterase